MSGATKACPAAENGIFSVGKVRPKGRSGVLARNRSRKPGVKVSPKWTAVKLGLEDFSQRSVSKAGFKGRLKDWF